MGSVTEICGAPGVGKTQLCIQLAVNALIPEVFEGVGGDKDKQTFAYVFDTEGSFVPQRIFEIAEATVGHFKCLAASLDPEEDRDAIDEANAMNIAGICDKILISRCLSLEELLGGQYFIDVYL